MTLAELDEYRSRADRLPGDDPTLGMAVWRMGWRRGIQGRRASEGTRRRSDGSLQSGGFRDLAEDPEAYAPVLEIDPNSDEVLWEPWVNGFERKKKLRADAWDEIVLSDDEDAAASVTLILDHERVLPWPVRVDWRRGRGTGPEGAVPDPGLRVQSQCVDEIARVRRPWYGR